MSRDVIVNRGKKMEWNINKPSSIVSDHRLTVIVFDC